MPETASPTPRRISVFDATLRDGEQAPGNAMSPEDKTALALRTRISFDSDRELAPSGTGTLERRPSRC